MTPHSTYRCAGCDIILCEDDECRIALHSFGHRVGDAIYCYECQEVPTLKAEIAAYRASLAAMGTAYTEAKARVEVLEPEVRLLRSERDEARQEVAALRAQVAELQALGASLHKATAKGREMERADVVRFLSERSCDRRERGGGWVEIGDIGAADVVAIAKGAHEGAAEKA